MIATSLVGLALAWAAAQGSPSPMLAEEGAREAIEEGEEPGSDGGFSATVTFATDYVFRGVSQTNGNPAVQGSLDYAHATGFYAGVWGSNVDVALSTAGVEIDLYAGYAKQSDHLGYDFALLYYAYPGDEGTRLRADFVELTGAVSYAFADVSLSPTVGAAYFYSPEYFAESGPGHYAAVSFSLSLPLQFGMELEVGYQGIVDGAVTQGGNWTHWRAAATKQIAGFSLELNYQDTTGIGDFIDPGVTDIADARVVFLVLRSF